MEVVGLLVPGNRLSQRQCNNNSHSRPKDLLRPTAEAGTILARLWECIILEPLANHRLQCMGNSRNQPLMVLRRTIITHNMEPRLGLEPPEAGNRLMEVREICGVASFIHPNSRSSNHICHRSSRIIPIIITRNSRSNIEVLPSV